MEIIILFIIYVLVIYIQHSLLPLIIKINQTQRRQLA